MGHAMRVVFDDASTQSPRTSGVRRYFLIYRPGVTTSIDLLLPPPIFGMSSSRQSEISPGRERTQRNVTGSSIDHRPTLSWLRLAITGTSGCAVADTQAALDVDANHASTYPELLLI